MRPGALVAVLVLSAIRTVEAEPCAPRAQLAGDAEAVTRVTAELKRLGVATDAPAPGCRGVSAVVEQERDGGISVAVRDSSQRSEGRVVSDPALAAAWIDSWLHDDFAVAPAPPPPAMPTAAPGEQPPHADVVATAPAPDAFERFALAASFEQAWTDTTSRWSGIGVSACVRVGGLCIGARGRYLGQTVTSGLSAASRTDMSLLATASYPRQVGTISIAPELGVGVGEITTERVDGCLPPPQCDPTDPMCKPLPPPPCTQATSSVNAIYVGDGFRASTVTPRAEAALRLAVPLASHVWLDGTLAVTFAPTGHGDPYAPTMPPPPGTNPMEITLPGEPLAAFQLGIGLRVGGP